MVQRYGGYVTTGQPVALNGRYLLPLFPGLGAVAAAVYAKLFEKLRLASYKPLFAVAVLLLLSQGGGPLTYIVRSRDAWYWPNTPAPAVRSEEHTSELQSLMRISYAVFCLKKKKQT